MKILMNNINNPIKIIEENAIICIGFFDGFHKGHMEIINKTLFLAKKFNLKTIFFTFDMKYNDFISKEDNRIFDNDFKKQIIEEKGFDYYYEFDFNVDSYKIEKEKFLFLLKNILSVKKVVIGNNFRFGYRASGNSDDIINFFGKKNTYIMPIIYLNDSSNIKISSTYIKSLLLDRNVYCANKLLIDKYQCKGMVSEGKKEARILGFPTANISLNKNLLINQGSYISVSYYNNKKYISVSYYSNKNNEWILETHFINQNLNLYNKRIKVKIIKFIAEKKKFNSLLEAKKHIELCCKLAVDYFL